MKNVECSDSELVSLYRGGNDSAFEVLLNRHKDKVFTTILLIVKDRSKSEDILQDAFIKAVRMIKANKYNDMNKFLPWVSRIGYNMAIDWFRRNKKRHREVPLSDGDELSYVEDTAELNAEDAKIREERHDAVRSYIKMLPDNQREVLIMRHYMDLSFQEIALKTGVSINTSLGRMRYALKNLRNLINEPALRL